jgi:hypothetical protein
MACLQETKLSSVSSFDACYIGGNRLKSFAEKPANGTRGGILLLWDESMVVVENVVISDFCLSADVNLVHSSENGDFKITTVYGPTDSTLKDQFFAEHISLKPPHGVRWLVLGDFRDALQTCELNEIHLQNRRFTWSNERASPTLCKLDAFYCNEEWDLRFGTHVLYALSSSLSDHCPLLLADDSILLEARQHRPMPTTAHTEAILFSFLCTVLL